MDKVYIVNHNTWGSSKIVEVFSDKVRADEFAKECEKSKKHSDGYIEYYVNSYNVNKSDNSMKIELPFLKQAVDNHLNSDIIKFVPENMTIGEYVKLFCYE